MLNINKSKWLMWVVFLIISLTGIFWVKNINKTGIESYKFLENYNASTVELQTIDRGLPFKLLFANAVKSPFSFNINLGKQQKKGIQSLWIYAWQADNHGQIAIEYEGKNIGNVDNQLTNKALAPALKLSYVGDINIGKGNIVLKITGSNNNLERHYAELGLVVLAPQGMSEGNVLSILNGRSEVPSADLGVLLILLLAAYIVLVILTKENNLKQGKTLGNDILAASVLAAILCFSYISSNGNAPQFLSNAPANERIGIERLIDSGLKNVFSKIKILQSKVLPNRQINDDVPAPLQVSAGAFNTDIYRIDQAAGFDKISKQVFSGKMADIQLMPAKRFILLASWILIAVLIVLVIDRIVSSWWSAAVALGLTSVLSILTSLRLSQGWDEFFINLRHAYMLLHHGVYSVNAKSMIEGSVDLLPLLATTFLGLFGIELVDAFIVTSLLGNVGVIVFSYLLVRKLTQDRTWALIAALVAGLYPNVVWVGATGFSAVLFSAWILAASYFILFTDRRLLGLIILSTLTLVRTEGILFAALLMAYVDFIKPLPYIIRTGEWKSAVKRWITDSSIVAAPFVLSLIVRRVVFGHALPTPITFKNTGLDSSYLSVGLDIFFQMISTHDLHLMIIVTALLLLANFVICKNNRLDTWQIGVRKLLALNLVIFLFILPYYSGGGDWFPAYWNRYGLPFNLVILLTFMVLLYGAFSFGIKRWVGAAALIVFCFALAIGYNKSAQFRKDNTIISTTAGVVAQYNHWSRIDALSSLGQFLRSFSPVDAVVSSPEEATIMYFSTREMMGLLGVSNPDMAAMPLQPIDPGNILHRRRGHASIFKTRPDVIALYEPVVVGDFADNPNLNEKILSTLKNDMFNKGMVNIAYYRVGSFSALEKMGYRHITISYPDRIFSLFVNRRIYDDLVKNMLAKGFKYSGSGSIDYSVDPNLTKKYVPAVKEIMSGL